MVPHRSFTNEKLFCYGRRSCAGPHQGDDLQLPSSEFTNGGHGLLARRELSLSQLLANEHLKLMCRSDITKKMDNRRGLVVVTGKGNTAHVAIVLLTNEDQQRKCSKSMSCMGFV